MQDIHDGVLLRRKQHAVAHPGARDDSRDLLDEPGVGRLDFEVDPRRGEGLEDLGEAGHAHALAPEGKAVAVGTESVARVELPELRVAEVLGQPGSIGHAIHALIVQDDDLAVASHLAIHLEEAHALAQGELEGGECVLGCLSTGTPMAEEVRAGRRQIGVHAHTVEGTALG